MSSSSPRYHIPFPKAFLSLNATTKKGTFDNTITTSPESELATHSFLSNRSTATARHASISSVSSVGSSSSEASSPPTKAVDSPGIKPAVPAFLTLNSKYATPPATAKEMSGDKHSFLSNRN